MTVAHPNRACFCFRRFASRECSRASARTALHFTSRSSGPVAYTCVASFSFLGHYIQKVESVRIYIGRVVKYDTGEKSAGAGEIVAGNVPTGTARAWPVYRRAKHWMKPDRRHRKKRKINADRNRTINDCNPGTGSRGATARRRNGEPSGAVSAVAERRDRETRHATLATAPRTKPPNRAANFQKRSESHPPLHGHIAGIGCSVSPVLAAPARRFCRGAQHCPPRER